MSKKIVITSMEKEIRTLIEWIDAQDLTVGKYIQSLFLERKEAEGKKVKSIKDFMEAQRDFTWMKESWRLGNLFQSIILDIEIPSLTFYRDNESSMHKKTLDGQQRLTTLYMIYHNLCKLDFSKTLFSEFEFDGEMYNVSDLQGKTLDEIAEINENFKKKFISSTLKVTLYSNCSDEMAEKLYATYNTGNKALTKSEIRKATMGKLTRRFFNKILENDFVLHTMSTKQKDSIYGHEVMGQITALLHENKEIELSAENIDNILSNYRDNGLSEELRYKIESISTYLNDTMKIWIDEKQAEDENPDKKKSKKVTNYNTYRFESVKSKVNTVMLMFSANKAIEKGMDVNSFALWSKVFFRNPSETYKQGLQDKAIEKDNVYMRMKAINDAINGEI